VRRTRRLTWLTIAVLGVYACFMARGVFAYSQEQGARETFPIFNWDLFSRVPKPDQASFGVRFTAIDGVVLTSPVYYEDSTLPTHQSSNAQVMIGVIGWAHRSGDEETVERYRRIWESRFLQTLTSAEYELVWREFTIEQREECDCFTSEVVVSEFTMGTP